jgi:hypothetical protein
MQQCLDHFYANKLETADAMKSKTIRHMRLNS